MAKIFDILRPEDEEKEEEKEEPKEPTKEPAKVTDEAEEKEENLWQAVDEDEEEKEDKPTRFGAPLVNCFLSIVFIVLLLVFAYLLFPDLIKINWKGKSFKDIIKKTEATLPPETKVEESSTPKQTPDGDASGQATTTTTTVPSTTLTKETIKIKAVNARGMKQAAATIKGILGKNGYKNIEAGDLNEGYQQTYVYYQNDNAKSFAEDIQKILLNGRNVKLEKSDKAQGVDVLVVGGLS